MLAPDTIGVGSGAGQDRARVASPLVIDASGWAPPPDNVSRDALARGLYVPSELRRSLGSRATHLPPCRMRAGSVLTLAVNVPSGLATVRSVGVVAAATSTALPVSRAWAAA